jgi:ATP-binding cassette subfamily F protein 3
MIWLRRKTAIVTIYRILKIVLYKINSTKNISQSLSLRFNAISDRNMISFENISFSVAGRTLVKNSTVSIPSGHKVGLVGRNGTGKTSLFRLVYGDITLDHGDLKLNKNTRVGGVAQEAPGSSITLLDTVLAADQERADLLQKAQLEKDPLQIAEIQTRLADIDAWSAEARAATILNGLGFDKNKQKLACSEFSGGWRMRVALAAVLFSKPDLLLLDEPSNYLDLEGSIWLEAYISKYPSTIIIISHDRALLNNSVNSILHLEDKELHLYTGNYETFAKTRAARLAHKEAEVKKQNLRRQHLQSYVDRFRYKADKAKQAQSRLKMLAKMEPISISSETTFTKFDFPQPEELSPPIVNIQNASVGYEEKTVLSDINLRIDQDDRIAILGQNGEGKSTLSKLIANKLIPHVGKIIHSNKLRIGYFAQHQLDELTLNETPMEHILRERPSEKQGQIRARLDGFGISVEQADIRVKSLSGGQKARLSLLLASLDAPHLLILDEPTNHLDIESREALVEALTKYSGAVIIVSHDIHLLSLVADRLWLAKNGTVKPYEYDLETYRKSLLSISSSKKPEQLKNSKTVRKSYTKDEIIVLKNNVTKSEERVEKLLTMEEKISKKLANPKIYSDTNRNELVVLNTKYAEVRKAMTKAEDLWEIAQKKLDNALKSEIGE